MYRSQSLDGGAIQWQTLWLAIHTEYRVNTNYVTVYTELVWPLISSPVLFLSTKGAMIIR